MKTQIIEFLKKNNLFLTNDKITIAASSGVDSMVLLHSMISLKETMSLDIIVCHVNHGKREQSNIEEQYMREYCSDHNLKLYVLNLSDYRFENNFQSDARDQRLLFFKEVMMKENSSYLFLAHHLNDSIETSFMHIIRGSSLSGYAGIKGVTYVDKYNIIRPFINILKNDIINYAQINNIKYFEDDSNASNIYTRNRVRRNIVPNFFEENINFDIKYLEFQNNILEASKIIDNVRDQYIKNNITIKNDVIEFEEKTFKEISSYMQTEILFAILKKYDFSKINIEEIKKLIYSSKINIDNNYKTIKFVKQYGIIMISDSFVIEPQLELLIENLGIYDIDDKYYLEVRKLVDDDLKKEQKHFTNLSIVWYNSHMFPFAIRTRRDGDRIAVNNGTKKVKDLLIDKKIGIINRKKALMLTFKDEIMCIFKIYKSPILKQIKENDIVIELREK